MFLSEGGKARDDQFFNCQQEHELYYVSKQYKEKDVVHKFLEKKCESGDIKYSTHKEVYELIKKELGYKRL